MDQHVAYMALAMEEALSAAQRGEVPIGAVIVNPASGDVVARNGNRTRELNDPSAHAEMLVIREACRMIGAQRIPEFDMYVTLEPCTMCAGAIAFARIKHLFIGALDEKGGGIYHGAKFFGQPTCHHKIELSQGFMAEDSTRILRDFFKNRR